MWGATAASSSTTRGGTNFNPRSPCGERPVPPLLSALISTISIHAPRVGSDGAIHLRAEKFPNFNPRSPCGERPDIHFQGFSSTRFQSTLPVWGATDLILLHDLGISISIHAPRVGSDMEYICTGAGSAISIHAPRVGSDRRRRGLWCWSAISIHAPRVGSDRHVTSRRNNRFGFQSTLPVWGATVHSAGNFFASVNFNPRSPCGERPAKAKVESRRRTISIHAPRVGSDRWQDKNNAYLQISIHAPRVGSDKKAPDIRLPKIISIHAPRVGSDFLMVWASLSTVSFQSTLPVWGATISPAMFTGQINRFQSTLPVWGATFWQDRIPDPQGDFNPRSPCGERPDPGSAAGKHKHFNPRSPCGERHQPTILPQLRDAISIHAPRVGSDSYG